MNQQSSDLRQGARDTTQDATRQARDQRQDTREQERDAVRDTRQQTRDATRQTRDQWQDTRDTSRDTFTQGRDRWQDTRDQGREALNQTRVRARDANQQSQDQYQQTRDQYQDSRDQSRNNYRDARQDTRDDRRDFDSQQTQRDFGRDAQRDFLRDDRRDQFSDRRDQLQDRFQDRRDQFSDRRDQITDRRDQFRDDRQDFQSDRRDMSRDSSRSSFSASGSSRTQISRAADIGLWFGRDTSRGLVISDISSSGPITRFGFREGDQIVSVNGTRVSREADFIEYLVSPDVQNQRVEVIVWRDGRQVPVWVEPWVLVQSYSTSYAQADPLEPLGIVLDDRYQVPVVWKVTPRTPAYYAGIRSGDVIVVWGGQHVNDPQDLIGLVQDAEQDEIQVQVSRNRQLRQLTLDLDGQTRTALRPNYEEGYGATTGRYGYGTARVQSGTYVQPGTYMQGQTYIQPGTYVQPGATYTQPGTYGQSGATYGQPTVRPGLLPRFRGR